jgi:hypothetical protein
MDCPLCGYCAPELGEPIGGRLHDRLDRHGSWRRSVKQLMASARYGDPFGIDASMPNKAISHLRCGVLKHAGAHFAEAGWSALYAAWLCDDAVTFDNDHTADVAAQCRRAALGLFNEAREARQRFARDAIAEELVIIDLLRRSGDFVRARERLATLSPEISDQERGIASRQGAWIALQNRAAHHSEEAPPPNP